ncbi:MAG TPA: peptide chain release factor 3 [Myxococcota bacterium]
MTTVTDPIPQAAPSAIKRRRTFAIISHPDAGKTTLTEKLLLYGGAIHLAGSVKARRASRHATSDWMAIEKERGISVATSVMQFEHMGRRFNLLDTPGHNDFSEDTYRTLAAADCAVMLVDVAKGVEPQTIKLFQVCRLRKIPIVTFINKLDREGKAPLDLLDEIEQVLGIPTSPLTWPVGMGREFQGVYERETKRFLAFAREERGKKASMTTTSLDDLVEELGEGSVRRLRNEIELLDDAGNKFDHDRFMTGEVTPVFFGSAMNNFGVEPFLDRFVDLCPPPLARTASDDVEIPTTRPSFAGFVFKIQANMDPKHRDRIAFIRVCSGRFEKGMEVKLLRTNKPLSLDRPLMFMAQERTVVEEAYAGDILGLWDPGNLRIGDTLAEKPPGGGEASAFAGVPSFSPEHFVRVRLADPLKRKQLQKGLSQLADEGAVQLFRERDAAFVDPVLGAVGWLQFEVLQHRLKSEYSVDAKLDKLPFTLARWVFNDKKEPLGLADVNALMKQSSIECFFDVEDRPLILFESDWMRRRFEDKHPELSFVAAVQPGRAKQ